MGYFRTEKLGDRWLFRDGQDRPFFSLGVNCVHSTLMMKIDGFESVNVIDKYGGGGQWFDRWSTQALERMKSWGFNTLGAWHERTYWGNHEPKTVEIRCSRYSKKVNNEWGMGFPDVFDPSFTASVHKAMIECFHEKGAALRDDEGLIGYYTDNELHWWGTGGKWGSNNPGEGYNDTHLVDDYIDLPPQAPGKKAWVDFIAGKYGTIEELNHKWGAEYTDFTDLLYIGVYRADHGVLEQDKFQFLRRIAEVYFDTTSSILKQYDPNHMNLGCRMVGTGTPPVVYEVMRSYVDVISINFYSFDLPISWLESIHNLTGKPMMVTEFSFCAGREAGFLYNTNGARKVIVRNQQRRAEAYDDFVTGAAKLPFMIGAHWFAYYDFGHRDGLIGNYGLVDFMDEPYEAFTTGVTATNLNVARRFEGL
jgi:hypothetical protein